MRKIADPLREFARAASNDKEVIAHINAIADQIDSEHERRMEQQSCELRKMAEKYVRQAYISACEKGNPITKDIITEDMRELGIEVD